MMTQPTRLRPEAPRPQRLHLALGPDGIITPLPVDDLPPEELRARVEALDLDTPASDARTGDRDRKAA